MRFQIVDGSPKADSAGDVRCARFEFPRQNTPGAFLVIDEIDHFTAEFDWLHFFKQGFLAVKHAGPGRSQHLVATESVEVGIQCLHIDLHVRRRLCAVHDDVAVVLVDRCGQFLDRIGDSQHVRGVADRQDFAFCSDDFGRFFDIDEAVRS